MINKELIKKPSQAVILAGGLGTRLFPITNDLPKPMIRFHGKPFLEYLIRNLKSQGFNSILILLGYMPEKIQEYFSDGSKWGIDISYQITPIKYDTGLRLKAAIPMLEDIFLLMYCDNYYPLNFELMWEKYLEYKKPTMLTVYSNNDGYTKDNLKVDKDNNIVIYDKKRQAPGLAGVDIGYILSQKELIEKLPSENISFEAYAYPDLINNNQLSAFVTHHKYYSIGSHDRLSLTDKFFSNKKNILLDRDGVINVKPDKANYVKKWSEWEWMPDAISSLKRLKEKGFNVYIISNQAGVGRGIMSEQDLQNIHDVMKSYIINADARIDDIFYCPHSWDAGCDCRKPKAGLFFQAQNKYDFNLLETYYIGDDERDHEVANKAGCKFLMVSESSSLTKCIDKVFSEIN